MMRTIINRLMATAAVLAMMACGGEDAAEVKAQTTMKMNIGQAIGAFTDATHGMTLSGVSIAYYHHIMDGGLSKFARFARNVWDIPAEGRSATQGDACSEGLKKTDRQLAEEGIAALGEWMREIGVATEITSLGVTDDMLEGIANATFILTGGYKTLTHEEIVEILKESM